MLGDAGVIFTCAAIDTLFHLNYFRLGKLVVYCKIILGIVYSKGMEPKNFYDCACSRIIFIISVIKLGKMGCFVMMFISYLTDSASLMFWGTEDLIF